MTAITLYRAKPDVVAAQEQDGQMLVIAQDGRKRTLPLDVFRAQYEPAEAADVSQLLRRALPPGDPTPARVRGRTRGRRTKHAVATGGPGRRRRCAECGKLCASPQGLAVHRARAHGTKTGATVGGTGTRADTHRCEHCDRTFKSAAGLGMHRVRCGTGMAKPGKAPRQLKATKSKDNLSGRPRIAMTKCPSCGAYSSTNPCERCHTQIAPGVIGQT